MPDPPRKPSSDPNAIHTWAKYSQIAFLLPSSVVAGLLMGALADRWFHITWGTVAGLIVGAVAGFVQLIRLLISKTDEDD